MGKIFDWDARNGSLIDQVSGVAGTLTKGNGGFRRTEKGTAMLFDGSTTKISINKTFDLTGTISFVISYKEPTKGGNYVPFLGKSNEGTSRNSICLGSSSYLVIKSDNGDQAYFNLNSLDNVWHQIIITCNNGTVSGYQNNKTLIVVDSTISGNLVIDNIGYGSNPSSNIYEGFIGNITVYNTALSTTERNKLYQDFLHSRPLAKPTKVTYPKPTDLSNVNGLVAAYNFSPQTVSNNQLLDISGNGNHGTINGALLTRDGMKFDGVDDYVDLASDVSLVSGTTVATRIDLSKITSTSYFLGSSGVSWGIRYNNSNFLFYNGTVKTVDWTNTNGVVSLVIVRTSSTNINWYVNGNLIGSTTCDSDNLPIKYIGKNLSSGASNVAFEDLRFYNYAFTPQQAKAYSNSFVKPYLLEDFSNHPVGDTSPKCWVKGTGSYKVSEETVGNSLIALGNKYLQNVTAGTTAIQSKQSYGTWEFSVYKGADSNAPGCSFISSVPYFPIPGVTTGIYRIILNDNESIAVWKNFNSFNLFTTATSYITNNTWYRIKVARLQSEGVFKDIETLQVSDLVNGTYTSFTSNGRYGFSAISDGSTNMEGGTADEINIVNASKYLVEFNIKLNSGVMPDVRFRTSFLGSNMSNIETPINGRNSIVFTALGTYTCVLDFFKSVGTTVDFEVSNLTIRRIYSANTFAVFIKGGAFGTDKWTLVDTTGGSGSNPVLDSTYTTSEYFVADLDAGDQITNIKMLNQVNQ